MLVLSFGAEWCGACKTNKPVVRDACSAIKVGFQEVDVGVESGAKLADFHGVSSLPTILVVDDGKELVRHSGVMTERQLRKYVDGCRTT